ncbi:hypothetical protein P3T76_012578 [Phytophthora citrophthora]|uniref:Uncharacterized protein n=1 Tax=Phytophthora citrophthora TaxID=4793 RepID=A0AAD9LCX9_9STRA|nr:hypothetical protein P3T76_012578 [Phytophthora citrophthora]
MPITSKYPPSTPSPIRSLMTKLISRNSDKNLPRKLVSTPFAASLLSPLSSTEMQHRELQLQRIASIAVLDATRSKKNELVITVKLTLKPDGIFVPNNPPISLTFHDVNQLSRVLAFCVDKSTRDCSENCEFCSELTTYLSTHWVRDPLVAVVNMGETVLRKPSLAMHLTRLVSFATGKGMAIPPIAVSTDTAGAVQLIPQLAPIGVVQEKKALKCTAQNEVVAVLYDFFNVFDQPSMKKTH